MDHKINALVRENQELKMQLTELRNAFDLNRQVLYVLSTKAEPTKRHFYIMLKKMNEHILDLAENQFQTRKDRLSKIEECKLLEEKYDKSLLEIQILKQENQTLRDKLSKSQDKGLQKNQEKLNQTYFTPKELHLILTEQIRKISNQLFVMGNIATKYKQENIRLKKQINVQSGLSGRNSQLGSMRNLQDSSPKTSIFLKKASLYMIRQERQRQQRQEIQELDFAYNSEDEQQTQGIQNDHRELTSFATTRNGGNQLKVREFKSKKQPKKVISPDNKQMKEYQRRQRVLEIKIQKIQQQLQAIKKENQQITNRMELLLNSQRAILNKLSPPHNKIQNRSQSIVSVIQLVQWRYKLKYLDTDQPLNVTRKLQKSKSIIF